MLAQLSFIANIPVIFQVASLLAALTPVTSLSMLPGIRSLAVAMHLEIHKYIIICFILVDVKYSE
ncbi:hypothetical protein [Photorhabdus bodei]|uniref:hypothetical protein n=1 Tax=Photorhabdus bodei TaxID=2029681 RepID=UPI0030ECDB52